MAERPPTVLVVEDDDDVRFLIEMFLANDGYEVRTARNGEMGLALLADLSDLPDLIVLDVEMPVLSGPGMSARLLVENAGRESIPIVLVSGAVDLSAIAKRIGTPYMLAKPFDPKRLLGLVARAAEERRPPRPQSSLSSSGRRGAAQIVKHR